VLTSYGPAFNCNYDNNPSHKEPSEPNSHSEYKHGIQVMDLDRVDNVFGLDKLVSIISAEG
jgi:hypothetical protein